MLQQNRYNRGLRYIKWIIKNFKDNFINLSLLFIIFILFKYTDNIIDYISYVFIIVYLFLGYVFISNKRKDVTKIPLKYTARIKRLIATNMLIHILIAVVMLLGFEEDNLPIYYFIFGLINYLNLFVILIVNVLNRPLEKLVDLHFRRMAIDKLDSMTNMDVIGITGSYGKTSSKNILGDILNVKYNALPTPRNLNTYNGLIMTVNNYMDKFTDIFIAEMGAYVKGEIAGLCKLIKPQYGILTKIGTAHLESFGSQENIQTGKFELIESLPSDGFGILNGDDPLQVSYKLKNNVRIIWIGIENKNVDVLAKNIKCSSKGTTFDVCFKNDKKTYTFETKLLGKHNVYNILEAIACGREFGIDIEDLIHAVKGVKTIEHRLELKKLGNFYMIDDAYNSNPEGAKRATEVLGMMDGIKVVVTPGMIELGDKEYEYNKTLGEEIGAVADYAVLIGEKRTKPIKEGLIKSGFNEDNIVILNDVREAYPFIETLTGKKEVYALFENDLPDTYNE
jgi:UDP-N-acetylmuramoyl-tripeptide--D-alanyl-D-alanine ligase